MYTGNYKKGISNHFDCIQPFLKEGIIVVLKNENGKFDEFEFEKFIKCEWMGEVEEIVDYSYSCLRRCKGLIKFKGGKPNCLVWSDENENTSYIQYIKSDFITENEMKI